jgi:hypothetical protein
MHNTAKTHSLLGAGGYKLNLDRERRPEARMDITIALYLTEVGAMGYAEYENNEHNIFMFEPEFLEDKFGEIPAFLTITMSAGQ